MLRKLFFSTAAVCFVVSGAMAQTDPAPAETAPAAPTTAAPADATAPAAITSTDGLLAANIIGENVYNSTADDAEKIGDVSDLVIDGNGAVKSLVVGVGGFLGIGTKDVEVDYKSAQWAEKNGDRWLVVTTTKEQLEALPAFERAMYDPTPAAAPAADPNAPATTAPATPPADAPKPVDPAPAN